MCPRRRYEVLESVGQGGMGTVFRARLRGAGNFEKDVALKLLRDSAHLGQDAEELGRRLRDEARILGLIRHRAVVHVDGLVRVSGRWAVVMEYIDGLDLGQVLTHWGPLPVSCALEVVQEVAGALHVAYASPSHDGRPLALLHRDIKPQNIAVTTSGEVKVLDFGVAKGDFDTREAETQHASYGSLRYMPQERVDGVDVPAGDVYSLGVVFFEMLSGTRWDTTLLSKVRHEALLHERVESLVKRGVPKRARTMLWNMMRYEPDDRPSARDVERFVTQIRGESGGMPLRDWTESNVPGLMAEVRAAMPPTHLTGEILDEMDESEVAPTRPVASEGAPMATRVLLLVLAVVAVVGVVLAGAAGFVTGRAF